MGASGQSLGAVADGRLNILCLALGNVSDEGIARATCQICGRAIKANTGLIAHHGYTRPQHEYRQTRSCFGSRYRPYEIAYDALDTYVLKLEVWLVDAQGKLNHYLANPPPSITYQRLDAWGKKTGEPSTYHRPEIFDVNKRPCGRGSYETRYWTRRSELVWSVDGLTTELAFFRERRAAWKEVGR